MLLFCTRGVRLTYDYDDGFPAVVEEALDGFFAKKAVKLISDVGVSISIQSIDSLSLSLIATLILHDIYIDIDIDAASYSSHYFSSSFSFSSSSSFHSVNFYILCRLTPSTI